MIRKIFQSVVLSLCSAFIMLPLSFAYAEPNAGSVKINIYPHKNPTEISPYIYGINSDYYTPDVTVDSVFQVGEKYTAYNWENNYSNLGDSWYQFSGTNLIDNIDSSFWSAPGVLALELSKLAGINNIQFKVMQLPLAGYVAADTNGPVEEKDIAPSDRWKEVIYNKQTSISAVPDFEDNRVYIDEYINYLVSTLGSSSSPTGIQAYCMDINPSEWDENYSLIHKYPVTPSELIRKSVNLSKAVKKIDSKSLLIGPNLSGFSSMIDLGYNKEWKKVSGEFTWFVDYYLSKMNDAEFSAGKKLLDVLGIQYYSEAASENSGSASGNEDVSNYSSFLERIQSTRTLWDSTYAENSEIGENYLEYLPIIPMLQASINTYNPDTELGFVRYNFGGGNNISGGIAQADALGIFATYGVYLAGLDPHTEYFPFQQSAINLYTDYDGKGSSFGSLLIPSDTSDNSVSSVYASYDRISDGILKVILINKTDAVVSADVSIDSSQIIYSNAEAYGFNAYNNNITGQKAVTDITDNKFIYELEPFSVTELIINASEINLPDLSDENNDLNGVNNGADSDEQDYESVLEKDNNDNSSEAILSSDPEVAKSNCLYRTGHILFIAIILCLFILVVIMKIHYSRK